MWKVVGFASSIVVAVALMSGCKKSPESQPGFNPETAKQPEKIVNPMEGVKPSGAPTMPGPMGPTGAPPGRPPGL